MPTILPSPPGSCFLLLTLSLVFGSVSRGAGTPDSLKASPPDTLARVKTPTLVGTLDRSLDPTKVLTQNQLHWIDYTSLGGILATIPGMYIRRQNSAGQYDQLNIMGYDWRGIAVLHNGRPLNDPASGIFNLYQFTTEYADRIEFITGPRAFLYGLNSRGGVVNIVTKNYDTNRPFTKFNYSQSAYDYEYSDGTFSQNLSRQLNFTFGFQHQSTSGRFPNSAYEAWNMRTKLRYNLTKDLTLILSEYLTHSETNLNGGVDSAEAQTPDAFNSIGTIMRNLDSYEKIGRNDVDLSLVGTVFGDTSDVTLLTLYYSNNLREYRDEENRAFPNGIYIHSDHRSSWMGAQLTQSLISGFQRFDAGGNVELRQIEGSPNLGRRRNTIASAWMKDEASIGNWLTVSAFARYDRYLRQDYAGVGSDVTLHLNRMASLFAGISYSRRLPNYEELYWTDSTVSRQAPILPEKHRNAEVGTTMTIDSALSLRIAYFHRSVDDAILLLPYGSGFVFPGVLFSNVDRVVTNGVETKLDARLWYLAIEGTATYLSQRQGDGSALKYEPSFTANGGIYFWGKVPGTSLELKAGLQGNYTSSQVGMAFNPEILSYRTGEGESIGYGGTVNFILIAHIGDAYVHFIWDNLTNTQFFTTPYYPVLDRTIRFGVSWEFLN